MQADIEIEKYLMHRIQIRSQLHKDATRSGAQRTKSGQSQSMSKKIGNTN